MDTQTQKTTAKDFFLNLGLIVALYTVVGNIISMLFTVINKAYPQITPYDYYTSYSISFPVATIIIFFPIFFGLSWLMNKDFVVSPEKKNLNVHKWLAYITLFVTGLAFAGDLVSVLYYFIDSQELTTGFLLKALVVLVMSGLVFFYYITDTRRVLSDMERVVWRAIAVVLVAGSIIWGFVVLGSPRTQQLIRYDEQKVTALQGVNNAVIDTYEVQGVLPTEFANIVDGYYKEMPVDEQTKQPYEYKKISPVSYQLCATFNQASVDGQTMPLGYQSADATTIDWNHPAGHFCFTETLKPIQNK